MTASPWLTSAEAIAYTRVHPNTLYKAVADGRLSAARTGTGKRARLRFRTADLDAWLDAGRRTPAAIPTPLGRSHLRGMSRAATSP